MTVIGDIIRVAVSGFYLQQVVTNVFFYQVAPQSTGFMSAVDWVPDWVAAFDLAIVDQMSASLTYNRVLFDNLTNGLEFADVPIAIAGIVPGDRTPSSVALGVTQARSTKITRNGGKRYAGLAEETVNGNIHLLSAPQEDAIAAFHDGILSFLDYDGQGNQFDIQNVIVGRTKDINGVYQIDLSKINEVFNASVNTFLTTQNSRKV